MDSIQRVPLTGVAVLSTELQIELLDLTKCYRVHLIVSVAPSLIDALLKRAT